MPSWPLGRPRPPSACQCGTVRVGYELTGLELDAAGTRRTVGRLRHVLEAGPVDLVPLSHPRRPRTGGLGIVARGLSRELAYLPVGLPRRAARLRLDLLHCPTALAPVRSAMPLVLTVHDVMALEHPGWFTRANVLQQRLVLGAAARGAAMVICPSAFTRDRVVERLRVERSRTRVVPWGVDESFSPGPRDDAALERLGVTGRYLLTVGTLQPRKNLEAALAAFERLPAGDGVELVVAGSRGWRDEALVARIATSPAAGRIRLPGRVSEPDLVALYRGAECFVYPSRYEGFGLPPLEAMACGTPVVAADRTSVPEVVGDAGVLVDPDDGAALAAALARLLSSGSARAEASARGRERAARFTWARCAEGTLATYADALARERRRSRRSTSRQ